MRREKKSNDLFLVLISDAYKRKLTIIYLFSFKIFTSFKIKLKKQKLEEITILYYIFRIINSNLWYLFVKQTLNCHYYEDEGIKECGCRGVADRKKYLNHVHIVKQSIEQQKVVDMH